MRSYKIDIFEEYCKKVEIDAENRDEAFKNLTEKFENGKVLEVEGEAQEYEEKIQNVERKTDVPIYFYYF